jgi:hypothetical protein
MNNKVYQLHDIETEEIIGSVLILNCTQENESELWEGWEDYHKLQEHEFDSSNINEFVEWFNDQFITQIENIEIDFIQLSNDT